MAFIHRIIDRTLEVFVGACLGLLVVVTFGQVVGRYLIGKSFGWAEELSVLVFCWTVWTTACLLIRRSRNLKVTFLTHRLPTIWRRAIGLLLGLAVLIFLGLVFWGSLGTLEAMSGISFISLPLPVNVQFLSVTVGTVLMAYYVIRALFDKREIG